MTTPTCRLGCFQVKEIFPVWCLVARPDTLEFLLVEKLESWLKWVQPLSSSRLYKTLKLFLFVTVYYRWIALSLSSVTQWDILQGKAFSRLMQLLSASQTGVSCSGQTLVYFFLQAFNSSGSVGKTTWKHTVVNRCCVTQFCVLCLLH